MAHNFAASFMSDIYANSPETHALLTDDPTHSINELFKANLKDAKEYDTKAIAEQFYRYAEHLGTYELLKEYRGARFYDAAEQFKAA